MNFRLNYIKKFLEIVGEDKSHFPILIFISLLNSFVDIVGIALLVPFFSYLFLPEYNFPFLFDFLNNYSKNELVLYFGLLIIVTFFLKIFIATYLYYYLTNFYLNFKYSLKCYIFYFSIKNINDYFFQILSF